MCFSVLKIKSGTKDRTEQISRQSYRENPRKKKTNRLLIRNILIEWKALQQLSEPKCVGIKKS